MGVTSQNHQSNHILNPEFNKVNENKNDQSFRGAQNLTDRSDNSDLCHEIATNSTKSNISNPENNDCILVIPSKDNLENKDSHLLIS